MKLLILFISIFSVFNNTIENKIQNQETCLIYLEDGSTKSGDIELPIKSDSKYIVLKSNNNKEKIELQQVNKMEVLVNGLKVEYHNLKVFNFSGKKILKNKKMMVQSVKGKVSLYIGIFDWSATINSGNGWQGMSLNGTSYYFMRDGEEAATLIHENFGQVNKNGDFKMYASRYFSDNEEIVNKIKNKEYTYKNIFKLISDCNQ